MSYLPAQAIWKRGCIGVDAKAALAASEGGTDLSQTSGLLHELEDALRVVVTNAGGTLPVYEEAPATDVSVQDQLKRLLVDLHATGLTSASGHSLRKARRFCSSSLRAGSIEPALLLPDHRRLRACKLGCEVWIAPQLNPLMLRRRRYHTCAGQRRAEGGTRGVSRSTGLDCSSSTRQGN